MFMNNHFIENQYLIDDLSIINVEQEILMVKPVSRNKRKRYSITINPTTGRVICVEE